MSARFRVWFSRRSARSNAARVAPSGSSPPRSSAASAASPRTRCSAARRFEPASVRMSEPDGKSKRGEPDAARELRARAPPVEPPRDHEVQGEEQVALEREDDPLPEPADRPDAPPLRGAEGRLRGPEQERAPEPDRLERRPATRAAIAST